MARKRNISAGDRVRVVRPQRPFDATVVRVNAKSVTVKDGRGKTWRVPRDYPIRVIGKQRSTAPKAPKKSTKQTAAKAGGRKRRWSEREAEPILAALRKKVPRSRKHFMEGGDGVTGMVMTKIPGIRRYAVGLSSNGEYSNKALWKYAALVDAAIPGAYSNVVLD